MRISVYSQELTAEVSLVHKTDERGETQYGIRLFFDGSPRLRPSPDDDEHREAITYWLPNDGSSTKKGLANVFRGAANLIDSLGQDGQTKCAAAAAEDNSQTHAPAPAEDNSQTHAPAPAEERRPAPVKVKITIDGPRMARLGLAAHKERLVSEFASVLEQFMSADTAEAGRIEDRLASLR